jgi:hypothetical protein
VAALRGNPKLTFKDNELDPDTIVREEGNWVLDGFKVGHIIEVNNSGDNAGNFTIDAIDQRGLTLTLVQSDSLSPEGPVDNITIEVSAVSRAVGLRMDSESART